MVVCEAGLTGFGVGKVRREVGASKKSDTVGPLDG